MRDLFTDSYYAADRFGYSDGPMRHGKMWDEQLGPPRGRREDDHRERHSANSEGTLPNDVHQNDDA
jgi:hypothetical protein